MTGKSTPLKRHNALKPLSREHHEGLLFCWKIRQGLHLEVDTQRIARYAKHFFTHHLQAHFRIEESEVFPLLGKENELIVQATDDHRRLRHLFTINELTAPALDLIQQQLEKHIRFEERVLFTEIQRVASEEEFARIEQVHAQDPVSEEWDDPFWK